MEIPPHVRRAIARRSLVFSAAILSAGVSLVVGLLVAGELSLALGALAGHLVAVACGLSWILGAVATFDGPFGRFARATVGLSPLRFIIVVFVVLGAGFYRDRIDTTALGLAFVATTVLFQIAQADCFIKLSNASHPNARPPRPLRFSGWKLW